MIALLAGAGFSKWAAELPLAGELFDLQIEPFGVREQRKLAQVQELKKRWDIDHPQGEPEKFIADALSSSEELSRLVLWYVVRRLSQPYIWTEWHAGKERRHVLMIDENRRFARPGVSEARRLLLEILSVRLAGIVTTNYDLLLEYALGTQEFNYGRVGERLAGRGPYPVSQWRNPVVLRGRVPIAKVHGSISWDRSSRYTDGRRGLTGDALIIAPVPGKEVPPHLRDQWNLAARILERSTRLIVFGFAFNPYDELFLEHLQHHGRHLREVLLVDPKPNFPAAQRLWPSARVLALPPPPEKESELRAWVRLEEIAVEELHEHLTSGWSGR